MRDRPLIFYGVIAGGLFAAATGTMMALSRTADAPQSHTLSLSAEGYRTAEAGAEIQKCKEGDATACFIAATDYESGHGVPRDATVATDYFVRACDMNFAGGCAGAALLNGTDVTKAQQFLRKACDLQDKPSCAKLASVSKPKKR